MSASETKRRTASVLEGRGLRVLGVLLLLVLGTSPGCGDLAKERAPSQVPSKLSDAEVENLVRRSYPYVAMYNVNNKFALSQGGWNTVKADTQLKDEDIARPNNDTLYIGCMLDLRREPMILEMPAFDSEYVSLMVTGYDHYVNVPMSTSKGDFRKPAKMLFYTERTEGYDGSAVDGIDRLFECTGDFVSAVFRVMPHSGDPARFQRIVEQMKSVKLVGLSEYRGEAARPIDDIGFPAVGRTDADTFGTNLLEVMQFVFNHTTFDPDNEIDQEVLAAYRPLGIEPGKRYDPAAATTFDGERFHAAAQKVAAANLAYMEQPEAFALRVKPYWFQPKGETTLDALVATSVIGPIGLPASEAEYPAVTTADGQPLNAMHDYVIRMTSEQLPPAQAFWSVTLYDMKNGFFIPNERRKYSVGTNAGMKLDEQGGIEIHVAAEKPAGVPEENWLPIHRGDEDLSLNLRIYVPDVERMKTWKPPTAEIVK